MFEKKLKLEMDKLKSQLKKISNPIKAKFLQGYFKTGSGEYGEGDVFIGITVPNLRKVAKEFETLEFKELTELIHSEIHEERLLCLLILGRKFHNKKADEKLKKQIKLNQIGFLFGYGLNTKLENNIIFNVYYNRFLFSLFGLGFGISYNYNTNNIHTIFFNGSFSILF